MYSEFYFNK